MGYVIVTIKSWNINNCKKMMDRYPEKDIILITQKEELTYKKLEMIHPEFVFFPHWSWAIPAEIYENFNCIVFHMTDLPFGRGGSPLQNLLVRGIYNTKISAIKVADGMDVGDIYMKEDLDIKDGNADEIFCRVSDIVFNQMIPRFMKGNLTAVPQQGNPTIFKRRRPEESEIPENLTQRQLYDFIRMLDGEGYPTAYRKTLNGKVYYRNAHLKNNIVYAEAEFWREEQR